MTWRKRGRTTSWIGIACLLACCWILFSPATASAHAILLRSNPPIGAVLKSLPTRVQMWFNEDLNPTFTTASVLYASKSTTLALDDKAAHADLDDAHVVADNPKEMELALKPHLPPAVYLVIYRTQSTVDGHILTDSFFFTLQRADGTVPTFSGSLPVPPSTEDGHTSEVGRDGEATLFSSLMTTLIDLGLVFWMGALLFQIFVFELTEIENEQLRSLYQEVTSRFERLFSIPTLWILLFAHVGLLIGQALVITDQGQQHLTLSLLTGQITYGQFGLYWVIRVIVIALALILASLGFLSKKLPHSVTVLLPWINLMLGSALLIAVMLSGHAAAIESSLVMPSIIMDGLHILAAALWVGGICYLAIVFLPVLRDKTFQEQTQALLSTLAYYSPLAIVGVCVMAGSGACNADLQLPSWSQAFTTIYGRILLVKIGLVGGLLLTSAMHVFWLRPCLKKTYKQYMLAVESIQEVGETHISQSLYNMKQDKQILARQVQCWLGRLIKILRWEPLLGVAVLICTGLLNMFAGTLQPGVPLQNVGSWTQQLQTPAKPLVTRIETTDSFFTTTLTITPNHQGFNVFTLRILKPQNIPQSGISVIIYKTMPGLDMGTSMIQFQPDGTGNFVGGGSFSMPGPWQLLIEIRTPDKVIHHGQIELLIP